MHSSTNQRLAAGLVDDAYVRQGSDALAKREAAVRVLLSQRAIPQVGWREDDVDAFLHELAAMDSNNFGDFVGAGERDGRIACALVRRRHFGFSHGIGRSGELAVTQPKAAGSSLVYKLANALVLHAVRLCGVTRAGAALLLPLATGMSISLVLSSLRRSRPSARFVLWSRIDQKSAYKAVIAAGFEPVVISLQADGDELTTDMDAMRGAMRAIGPEQVLAVLTTTSAFAPRGPDRIVEVAVLCKAEGVPHVINNAYGLQSSRLCHDINEACRVGRVDAFVQSTDKNLLVPVGGAIVSSPTPAVVDAVSRTYPGRASASPVVDVFATLLSLGIDGLKALLAQRRIVAELLKRRLATIAEKYGERVLQCPRNSISFAMTIGVVAASPSPAIPPAALLPPGALPNGPHPPAARTRLPRSDFPAPARQHAAPHPPESSKLRSRSQPATPSQPPLSAAPAHVAPPSAVSPSSEVVPGSGPGRSEVIPGSGPGRPPPSPHVLSITPSSASRKPRVAVHKGARKTTPLVSGCAPAPQGTAPGALPTSPVAAAAVAAAVGVHDIAPAPLPFRADAASIFSAMATTAATAGATAGTIAGASSASGLMILGAVAGATGLALVGVLAGVAAGVGVNAVVGAVRSATADNGAAPSAQESARAEDEAPLLGDEDTAAGALVPGEVEGATRGLDEDARTLGGSNRAVADAGEGYNPFTAPTDASAHDLMANVARGGSECALAPGQGLPHVAGHSAARGTDQSSDEEVVAVGGPSPAGPVPKEAVRGGDGGGGGGSSEGTDAAVGATIIAGTRTRRGGGGPMPHHPLSGGKDEVQNEDRPEETGEEQEEDEEEEAEEEESTAAARTAQTDETLRGTAQTNEAALPGPARADASSADGGGAASRLEVDGLVATHETRRLHSGAAGRSSRTPSGETPPPRLDRWSPSYLGSMLFSRGVSGSRVVDPTLSAVVDGRSFQGYGAHCDAYPVPYLTAAAAMGMTEADVEMFASRLDRTLAEYVKQRGRKNE